MSVRWGFSTPTGAAGAIAAIALAADDPGELDSALQTLIDESVAVGGVRVRTVAGVDRAVVARWSPTRAEIMPHAGRAIARELAEKLREVLGESCELSPGEQYPEADDEIEARALAALAHAASPLAVDLLLDQPRRWREHPGTDDVADGRALAHLLTPALVVAVGPPNVGKSSLLNALAGRSVALAADEPGTTRDHVGALLELDGVVVRYADTPGVSPAAPMHDADRQAHEIARALVARADLVLSCFDATAQPMTAVTDAPCLFVATRADLGPTPNTPDLVTSARSGSGVPELALAVRRRLVPDAALADPRPWRFWDSDVNPALA
ncbi:MAG: GTPase [Phycisphaerales bacterium]